LLQISTVYFSDQILILFGSCIMAAVVEEYSLHRRLALTILRHTGNSPYRLVLGRPRVRVRGLRVGVCAMPCHPVVARSDSFPGNIPVSYGITAALPI
jgi:hypothetical protein